MNNLLLKINAKVTICFAFVFLDGTIVIFFRSLYASFLQLGGLNSLLAGEVARNIPVVSNNPTMIFGMDVSHGSPGHSDVPSIAAVS